jgi:hypothetical protein
MNVQQTNGAVWRRAPRLGFDDGNRVAALWLER